MSCWQALTPLPAPRNLGSAVVSGNHIFVIGGCAEGTPPFSTAILPILRAKIDSNGALGNWTQISALVVGKISPGLSLSREGYLYMMSGAAQADVTAAQLANARNVRVARIDPDGTLRETPDPADADLIPIGDMPYSLSLLAMARLGDYFYGLSGFRAYGLLAFKNQTVNFQVGEVVTGGTSGATMIVAAITDDGATGSLASDHLNNATFIDSEVLTGDMGGAAEADGTTSFTVAGNSTIARAPALAGGGIGAWTTLAELPFSGAPNAGMVVYQNRFYFVNGELLCHANVSEAAASSWQTLPMPEPLIFTWPVLVGDTLFVIGGGGAGTTSSVYCIKLGSNGPVGSWYKTESLPGARLGHGMAVSGNRIYVVGGGNFELGESYDTVWCAEVSDGCIGGVKIPV